MQNAEEFGTRHAAPAADRTAADAAVESGLAAAARGGDRKALDELIRRCLPAVYGLVRRRAPAVDAEDVVQETLLRVVRSVHTLRDPARFRSWVLAIAVHESSRRRSARRMEFDHAAEAEIEEVPGAVDEEQRTLARLALAEQRREVSEAAGWLDPGDQDLLALWWLELVGQLDRTELGQASGVTGTQLRVRLQRLRERLDRARVLVRLIDARDSVYGCSALRATTAAWDGNRSPLWRKRLVRHVDNCSRCAGAARGLVPVDRLLAGVLVPLVPPALADSALRLPAMAHGPVAKLAAVVHRLPGRARPSLPGRTRLGLPGKAVRGLAAKPVVAAAAAAVVATTGTVAWTATRRPPDGAAAAVVTVPRATAAPDGTAAPSPAPGPSASAVPTSVSGSGITYAPAPGTGQGRTFHVSPRGDDTGPGTAARPFRTINRATQRTTLRPGDTVLVAAGTYVEKVRLRGSGSATRGHITLRGEPGAVIRDPSPAGAQNWIPGGTVVADRVGYWLIEGLEVEHSEWGAIVLAGTDHVIVANNRIDHAGASGIIALPGTVFDGGEAEVQSHAVTIVSNTLSHSNERYTGAADAQRHPTVGDQEALSIWGVDGFEVAGNRVTGCTREGIDAKTGSRHGRIHHNTVTGCASIAGTAAGYRGGAAVYLDGNRATLKDIEVDHNEVAGNTADAVVVADEVPASGDVRDVRIHDNVIRDNGRLGLNGGAGVTVSANVTGVLIEHNTFYRNVQAFVVGRGYLSGYDPSQVVLRRNVMADSSFRNGGVLPTGSVRIEDNVLTPSFPKPYELEGANPATVSAAGNRRVARPLTGPPANLRVRPGVAADAGHRGAVGAPAGPATPVRR